MTLLNYVSSLCHYSTYCPDNKLCLEIKLHTGPSYDIVENRSLCVRERQIDRETDRPILDKKNKIRHDV